VAEAVDEGLARRGRFGPLVEFGLPDGDAGLVGDGARQGHVGLAPAPRLARGRERERARHLVADADGDEHQRARAERAQETLVELAEVRFPRHVLEGQHAALADLLDEAGDERETVLVPAGHDAGRGVLGGVARDARLAVDAEEDAAVGAEVVAEFADGRAEDLFGVERLADGARDAVDEGLAFGLRGESLGVAQARDELRRLPREGERRQDLLAVGGAARARVVERDEADQLAVVRDERDEQLVVLVPGPPAVLGQGAREVGLEARARELVEQVVVGGRVVGGEAERADPDAHAALDEPLDQLARVGAVAGALDVLARHVGGAGEDAAVVGRLVGEEEDEAGAVVGQFGDGVGEPFEELFEGARVAGRGGEGRQRFELPHGSAQTGVRVGPLGGEDF
jgi:hypothetical protein